MKKGIYIVECNEKPNYYHICNINIYPIENEKVKYVFENSRIVLFIDEIYVNKDITQFRIFLQGLDKTKSISLQNDIAFYPFDIDMIIDLLCNDRYKRKIKIEKIIC